MHHDSELQRFVCPTGTRLFVGTNDTGIAVRYNSERIETRGSVLNPGARKKKAPDPSPTRTDRDWVMIVIGLTLVILFAYGGYSSVFEGDKGTLHKFKGPVKDPKSMGMYDQGNKYPRETLRCMKNDPAGIAAAARC